MCDYFLVGSALEYFSGFDGAWNGAMFREISGTYVVSGAAVLVTLMFDYVAVRLRGCGYDSEGDTGLKK